jgi:hypothetical protein
LIGNEEFFNKSEKQAVAFNQLSIAYPLWDIDSRLNYFFYTTKKTHVLLRGLIAYIILTETNLQILMTRYMEGHTGTYDKKLA